MIHRKVLYISILWTTLIFMGYNILLTADNNNTNNNMTIPNEAEGSTTTDSDSPKEICKDYDGKWKDGTCNFKNEDEDDEVAFDHYMADEGLWDDYAAKQQEQDKEFKEEEEEEKEDEGKRYVNPDGGAPLYEEELTEEEKEKDYYEEIKPSAKPRIKMEDWRNEVEPIDDAKIPSTTLKFNDEEEREKYEKEMEKHEVETIEPTDDGTPEPDPVEESSDDGAVEEEPEEENNDSGGGEDEE